MLKVYHIHVLCLLVPNTCKMYTTHTLYIIFFCMYTTSIHTKQRYKLEYLLFDDDAFVWSWSSLSLSLSLSHVCRTILWIYKKGQKLYRSTSKSFSYLRLFLNKHTLPLLKCISIINYPRRLSQCFLLIRILY
jgi:hypothetical protein